MQSPEIEPSVIVALPLLYNGMTKGKIKLWYVDEDPATVIEPGRQLVSVDAGARVYTITTPPEITKPHRVKNILREVGDEVLVGENILVLEPVKE